MSVRPRKESGVCFIGHQRRRRWCSVTVSALATLAASIVLTGASPVTAVAAAQPNVVVIMVDDMNVSALAYMPQVRSLIGTAGTTFTTSVVSYSLCCPSRTTFLTGQYAHNHGVLDNAPPDGGYAKLRGAETLPVWLRRAGYATGHVGKFLNGYGTQAPTEIPPGWTEWYGSVDPTTYRMWGYTLNENGMLRTYGTSTVEDPALYQTDVYATHAQRPGTAATSTPRWCPSRRAGTRPTSPTSQRPSARCR